MLIQGSSRTSNRTQIEPSGCTQLGRIALFLLTVLLAACSDSTEYSTDSPTESDANDSSVAPVSGGNQTSEVFRKTGLVINEIQANAFSYPSSDNVNVQGAWAELYNGADDSINLKGFALASRGVESKSWTFPDVTVASGGFLRVWGGGYELSVSTELQTDFSIMGAQTLSLLDQDNNILDRVTGISFPSRQSWGRYPDGSDSSRFYSTPSPGRSNPESADVFSLNCEYLTLSAGSEFTLETTPDTTVRWSTDNAIVQIDTDGLMTTSASGVAGESEPVVVTATDSSGFSRECTVTVANWHANRSKLTVLGHPRADFLLDNYDGKIFFTVPGQLFKADSGFKNVERAGVFPPTPSYPVMLKTPYGYFASSGKQIYSTQDFQSWKPELSMSHINLQHGFSSHFDQNSLTNYLYAGEYSVESRREHAVHRGRATGANTQWDKVLNWGPEQDFYDDNSKLDTIRHVHAVVTDPYTGNIYVATGDVDQHSRLYYSSDNGDSFKLLALGSQKYRSLSIWFTEKYVYWNMDSERADQHVYRLARSVYNRSNSWPALTPELSSGTTTVGVRYLVSATAGRTFPAAIGNYFYETEQRTLSSRERVYAIEDPQFDYSESVADLTHASQWYHLWVKDQNNEDVLIMSTSAEGSEPDLRDYNSRVFGFKEHEDGSVDVQELLSMPSRTPSIWNPYSQLIPAMQDDEGYIYFQGRQTTHRTFKTRLTWIDSP